MIEKIEEYSLKVGTQEIKLSSEKLRDPYCMPNLLSDIIEGKEEWVKLVKTAQLEVAEKLIRKLVDLRTNLDVHNRDRRTPLICRNLKGEC